MKRRWQPFAAVETAGMYVMGVALALATICAYRAHAEVSELVSSIPDDRGSFGELIGADSEIELNGERLSLSSLRVAADPATVLARFDVLCRTALTQSMSNSSSTATQPTHSSTTPLAAAERPESSGQPFTLPEPAGVTGSALCFEKAPARASQLYQRSGDLSAFGQLRYLLVRSSQSAGSHVLLARARGSLRLARMFSSAGDAQGRDLRGVPRPDGGRRVLSAQLADRPAYGVVAYAVASAAREAFSRYAAELEGAGFRMSSVGGGPDDAGGLAIFSRGADWYIVRSHAATSGSWISVVDAGHEHEHEYRGCEEGVACGSK